MTTEAHDVLLAVETLDKRFESATKDAKEDRREIKKDVKAINGTVRGHGIKLAFLTGGLAVIGPLSLAVVGAWLMERF